jgi:hypothetical protein
VSQRSELIQTMHKYFEEIHQAINQIRWEDPVEYAAWLSQTYYYVAQTTRMICLAAAKSTIKDNDLHIRYIVETKEELNHEKLAFSDLKNLGFTLEDFPETVEAAFFYQTLGYAVECIHPSCLLGYSILLEGYAALKAEQLYTRVLKSHGPTACTFLKLHCEADKNHFAGAMEFLEKKCKEEHIPYIHVGMEQCRSIYLNLIQKVRTLKPRQGRFAQKQAQGA